MIMQIKVVQTKHLKEVTNPLRMSEERHLVKKSVNSNMQRYPM